jgi:protein-L-isoaspartate O-methyltransferase
MDQAQVQLQPGTKVKVIQQIAARDRAWPTEVVGTVVSFEQKKTGSWFAHSKDDKLWLDRLTIRKDDGAISVLNLDQYSRIEVL